MELLHLVIPGLFFPKLRGLSRDEVKVSAPSLEWLLHRSKRSSSDADCVESTLLHLFGIRSSSDTPVAPINYHSDFGQPPSRWCMHADPVYMVPQGDGLVIESQFDAGSITPDEANRIAGQFNQLYGDLDISLVIAPDAPHRWYIEMPAHPGIQTHPLMHVMNRNVNPYLPFGDSEQKWHQIINEFQMLLHSIDVNISRQNNQQRPVNSFWIWGEGQMPEVPTTQWNRVYSDTSFSKTLSELSQVEHVDINGSTVEDALHTGRDTSAMWVVNAPEYFDDLEEWQMMVDRMEKDFFVGLRHAIYARKLQNLLIDTGVGSRFHITAQLSWRIWQRKKHFTDYLNAT